MSTVEGRCYCDICKKYISDIDEFTGTALSFENDKHICKKCVEYYIEKSGEKQVVSLEQVEEFVKENGNRLKKDKSAADSVLDELLKDS
ncbi:hypothetical protein [Fundidesulfovibrio agrisoli]|uniref:hypothetical protein n=1 Tax=Fundidesulfovibrio agrisoli TaxID=2922717 RepID=UPI001FACE846|nr:hypothetical protein [Fundidesulfovibrio agrisoli]